MPDPISESDLLAIIENGGGTLTPTQTAEIQALLRADPGLRARVERMIADRDALARLPDSIPAPHRTAEFAMRRAAETTAAAERTPGRAQPSRTAMLVAAGVGLAILGGVLAFIINATHPKFRANRIAESAPTLDNLRMAEPDSTAVGPEPEPEPPTGVAAMTTAEEIAAKVAALEAEHEADPLLESFLANIPEKPEQGPGLTQEEIVALLREGALAVRITIDTDAVPGAMDHADTNGASAPNAAARPVPDAMPVDIPDDATDEMVLAALEHAAEPLRARSGFHVEFVRAPAPASGAESTPLATDPRAVLWWSAPPDQWRTVRTRTVPVLVQPEPASSGAPPQPASG